VDAHGELFLLAVVLYFVIGFVRRRFGNETYPQFLYRYLSPAKYRLTYENITITARIDSMQIAAGLSPLKVARS